MSKKEGEEGLRKYTHQAVCRSVLLVARNNIALNKYRVGGNQNWLFGRLLQYIRSSRPHGNKALDRNSEHALLGFEN